MGELLELYRGMGRSSVYHNPVDRWTLLNNASNHEGVEMRMRRTPRNEFSASCLLFIGNVPSFRLVRLLVSILGNTMFT